GRNPPSQKGDKCLAAVYYDRTDIASAVGINDMAAAAAVVRKLTLVETPTPLASSNNTPGLIVADILAYLKSWDVISPNPDAAEQAALFETSVEQVQVKKLETIRQILKLMKKLSAIG